MTTIKLDGDKDFTLHDDGTWEFNFDCDSQGFCQDLYIEKEDVDKIMSSVATKGV